MNGSIYDKGSNTWPTDRWFIWSWRRLIRASLMQGDYMVLRFQLAQDVRNTLPRAESDQARPWRETIAASDGHVVVTLDEQRGQLFGAV